MFDFAPPYPAYRGLPQPESVGVQVKEVHVAVIVGNAAVACYVRCMYICFQVWLVHACHFDGHCGSLTKVLRALYKASCVGNEFASCASMLYTSVSTCGKAMRLPVYKPFL